jgi:hypothetical protein
VLKAAEQAFERSNPTDNPPWLQYFDEAYMAAKFGHCFRELGQGDKVSYSPGAPSIWSTAILAERRSMSFCSPTLIYSNRTYMRRVLSAIRRWISARDFSQLARSDTSVISGDA